MDIISRVVSVPPTAVVLITGATGSYPDIINGRYKATDQVHNNKVLFAKVGGDKYFLRYHSFDTWGVCNRAAVASG